MHALCAVSGGADSVALLRMLCEKRDRGELQLTAAHFEHGIRGLDSQADAAFVRALCQKLSVPLIEGSADVPALARAANQGLEQAAREARHGFLRDAKARLGADVIALGHHRGDQAETVLMHIARGAGIHGAQGMGERDGDIWRPLLDMSKAEILSYLDELGQDHREDITNQHPDNPRNAIRHNVLPALSAIYPGAEAALCRFAQIARAEDELVSSIADAFFDGHAQRLPNGWRVAVVGEPPLAVLRRALSRAARAADFDTIERLIALYRAPRGKLSIPGGALAERTGAHLYLIDPAVIPPDSVPFADGASLPGVGRISIESCEPAVRDLGPRAQIMDAAALRDARFRCRKPNDRFQMLGSDGGKPLPHVMIDRRIDRPLRDFWPVVAYGNEILWIPGVGVSERAKVTPGTREAVLARFEPWVY